MVLHFFIICAIEIAPSFPALFDPMLMACIAGCRASASQREQTPTDVISVLFTLREVSEVLIDNAAPSACAPASPRCVLNNPRERIVFDLEMFSKMLWAHSGRSSKSPKKMCFRTGLNAMDEERSFNAEGLNLDSVMHIDVKFFVWEIALAKIVEAATETLPVQNFYSYKERKPILNSEMIMFGLDNEATMPSRWSIAGCAVGTKKKQ